MPRATAWAMLLLLLHHTAELRGTAPSTVPNDVARACELGHEAEVLSWLDGGGNVDAQCQDSSAGSTLLMRAASAGHERLLEALLLRGAAVDQQDNEGWTALTHAVLGWTTRLDPLSLTSNLRYTVDQNTGTLQQLNSETGIGVIEALLRQGAAVDRQVSGVTALMVAANRPCSESSLAVMKALLRAGAATRARNKNGKDALYMAKAQGHSACVEAIEERANLHAQLGSARAPVEIAKAAEDGDAATINAWLAGGGQVDAAFKSGFFTLLMAAAGQGHQAVVEALLQRGADTDRQDANGWTPLMFAAFYGHEPISSALIRHGASVHLQNSKADTALLIAAFHAHEPVIDLLLQHGADINVQNNANATPLLTAVINNHIPAVIQLLQAGADPSIRKDGMDALQTAQRYHHFECLNAIEDHTPEVAPLHRKVVREAKKGDVAAVTAWLDRRPSATINASYTEGRVSGRTLLMLAADNGHERLATALLQRGADVNQQSSAGESALTYATAQGHWPVMDALLRYGANVNIRNSVGGTALMIAAVHERTNIVTRLLQAGADPGARNEDGVTALEMARGLDAHACVEVLENAAPQRAEPDAVQSARVPKEVVRAAEQGDVAAVVAWIESGGEVNAGFKHGPVRDATLLTTAAGSDRAQLVVELLIRGANMDQRDGEGRTALMKAAFYGLTEMVGLLLRHGAAINLQNSKLDTALILAAFHGHMQTIDVLLQHGADVDLKNSVGGTALMAAVIQDNPGVVTKLLRAGTDPEVRDMDNMTVLETAQQLGYRACIEAIEKHSAERGAWITRKIVRAAEAGDEKAIAAWLGSGGQVDARFRSGNASGLTMLMTAAIWGRVDVVELLLRNGADVDLKSFNISVQTSDADFPEHTQPTAHARVVDGLLPGLPGGADIDFDALLPGYTALMFALDKGHAPVAITLLQHGADINIEDFCASASAFAKLFGYSACAQAIEEYQREIGVVPSKIKRATVRGDASEVVAWLDGPGQDSSLKETLLVVAAEKGHTQLVDTLLRRGANVNYQSRMHSLGSKIQPALLHATESCSPSHVAVVRRLLQANPDTESVERAFQLALNRSHHACVQAILEHEVESVPVVGRLLSIIFFNRVTEGALQITWSILDAATRFCGLILGREAHFFLVTMASFYALRKMRRPPLAARRRLRRRTMREYAVSALMAVVSDLTALWLWAAAARRRADEKEPARGQRRRVGGQGRGRERGAGGRSRSEGGPARQDVAPKFEAGARSRLSQPRSGRAATAERGAQRTTAATGAAEVLAERARAESLAVEAAVRARAVEEVQPALVCEADRLAVASASASASESVSVAAPASAPEEDEAAELARSGGDSEEADLDGEPTFLPSPPTRRPAESQQSPALVPLASANFDTGRPAVPESTLGGESTCIICFTRAKSHVAIPCGHLCACEVCSARMEQCPICRDAVVMWFQSSRIREA